jgi:hypothetical protein
MTLNQQPFRFLDLSLELRPCVYEHIDFHSTWHVLDRPQAMLNKSDWPVSHLAQVYESRITLIRPHAGLATAIVATCHLIHDEARPILQRKNEHCRAQLVRYL